MMTMQPVEIVRRAVEFDRPPRLPFWQHWNHKMPGFADDVHNIWEMDRAEAGGLLCGQEGRHLIMRCAILEH